jgi:glycosyltransferase involved in cell wall biosynthesis
MATQIEGFQAAGFEVDVLVMRGRKQPGYSVHDGVHVHRIPSMERKRAGKVRYVAEYFSFFIPSFFVMAVLQILRGYRVVEVTNLPDLLLFSAFVPKLLGAKLIFDVRECTPEMFMDRFKATQESKIIRVMTWIEQLCLRFATATTTCTEAMRQALIARGADPAKISIVLNVGAANLRKEPMLPDPTDEAKDQFRIITHGTIIKRYGHDVLIDAMAEVVKRVPQAHLEILGRGQLEAELKRKVQMLGLEKHVTFSGFVDDDVLLQRLRKAHVGVVPLEKNPESDLVHTYKMFEYIHLGIPTVISRTTGPQAYFADDALYYFEPGSAYSLANALVDLAGSAQKRYTLAKNALNAYENYVPAKQVEAFARLVKRLTQPPPAPRMADSRS